MAAHVDVASGEVGQAGDAGVKPAPGPKPCLIPKPFSLQRNTTFRSIPAPKTLTTTPQPSQTTPTTSIKSEPCQPISAAVSDSSSAVKLDRENTMIPELANALKAPSAIIPQTDSTHITEQNQTALSTSLTTPTSEPPASTTSDPTGTSEANQVSLSELDEHGDSDTGHSTTGTEAVPSPSVTPTILLPQSENTVSEPTPQAARWGGGRKRLSMELTSRFESAGLSLPSQPPDNQEREQVTKRETAVPKVSVLRAKEEEKVTDSPGSPSDPQCRLKHSTPLKEERDEEGVKEEGEKKGSSIQRRISLLLDSSLRPEALTKMEEVPCPMKQADSSVGVKQRIKDWAADTPPVPASNQRVAVAPQPFPVRVHPVLSVTGGSLATSKSVQLAPREDKASTLLHSGHSGIEEEEEEDDEEEEEEEEGEDEKEDKIPLYKTVGRHLGQEDGGTKQELVVGQIRKEVEAKVKEEEKLAEVEKLKQLEVEQRQAEEESERERQKEVENEKERERQNEEERERNRDKERERERQKVVEMEKKRQREREEEMERKRQREREKEMERERQRETEIEREMERQRQKEEERDRERQRDEEERETKRKEEAMEREKRIELEKEKERQREEEIKRKEEEEREKQIELEKEKERQREEERKRKEEAMEREKQIELEKEKERQREEERKRKEEAMRERQRKLEMEMKRQVEEGEIRVKEERLREKEREKRIEEEREMERQREEERMQEDERQREEKREKEEVESPIQLITLKPGQSPKPEPPSPSTTVPTIEPIPKEEKQPHIEVVYDDFSVKEEKPLIKIVYDDFSVKPRRWGSQARFLTDRAQVESPSPGTEEPESLGPSKSKLQRTVVDTQDPAQESSVSVEPHPAERDLEGGVPTPEDGTENEKKEKKEDQLKCCVGAGEGRDTEALTGGEPDKQYGACDTRLSEDDSPQTTEDQISPVITPDEPDCKSPIEETEDLISPVITPDEPDNTSPLEETEVLISPVITPDEPDSTSPLEETEDPLPFPDISGPLLDTSVLRARAELRKSRRTRPPRTIRQSSTTVMLEEDPVHDWRFYDSSKKVDSLTWGDCESEEQPRGREICSPPSQPQRIALFSGMDPSALKAQLKKRGGKGGGGGGGVAGGGEGVDTDRQTDRLEPSPSQLSHSPRRSSFLPGASRVLPPVENKGGGRVKSPSWLRELKFKKRSSQQ